MLRATLVALVAALALGTPVRGQGASAPPTSAELLERAIFNEETVGDLDAAIALYREILARAEADRPFAAQAQLRLGLCHLKRGQEDEAIEALRALVEDFPRHEDAVARARAALRELGVPLPDSDVVLRKVWADGVDVLGSPSPDGRYLSFTDWSTGDLALHDFETGEDRRLTGKGEWSTGEFAEVSVISPEGGRVAYAWYDVDERYRLRVVGIDGSAPATIFEHADSTWLMPVAWSPDGAGVLTHVTFADRASELVLVPAGGGEARTVAALEVEGSKGTAPELEGRTAFSPDGRWIVYSRTNTPGQDGCDVYVLSLENGEERALVRHPANDLVLGWDPSGRQVLFASDRRGSWDAWAISVADGSAKDEPVLVHPNLSSSKGSWLRLAGGIYPLGFSDDGSLLYGLSIDVIDVYTVALDRETGRAGEPVELSNNLVGAHAGPEWSPAGDEIAFLVDRQGAYAIAIVSQDGRPVRELAVSEELDLIVGRKKLDWSPDGGAFLVNGRTRSRSWADSIFAIDARTGDARVLAEVGPEGGILRHAQWSPDGETVWFERRSTDVDASGIFALALAGGVERLVRPGSVGPFALAPDGQRLVFTTDWYLGTKGVAQSLSVLDLESGEERVVWTAPDGEGFEPRTALLWTPDGRSILFGRSPYGDFAGTSELANRLWRIAADGSEPVDVGLDVPWLRHVRMHPRGDRLVFDAGRSKLEVWALENFLPREDGR